MFVCMQQINLISNFCYCCFLRCCKDIANFLFWEHWECFIIPIKIMVSICSKLSCLSACKKSTSSPTSFLWHCKEIENLLFWVIWACLATRIWSNSINLKKSLVFICRQNIIFILHVSAKHCKVLQTCFGYFGHD